MHEQAQNYIVVIGALFVLYGVFRLVYINHRSPNNVGLTGWMLTGGLIELVAGLLKGTVNIFRLYFDANARGAISIYFGIVIISLTV